MPQSVQKARFSWHCRRGMLELDLILHVFLEKKFDSLNTVELASFEEVLQLSDPELYAWLMGHEEPKDQELAHIVRLIRNCHSA